MQPIHAWGDTDGDGVGDGSEYYGFFYEQSHALGVITRCKWSTSVTV